MEVRAFEFVNAYARQPAVEAVCGLTEQSGRAYDGKVSAGMWGGTLVIAFGTDGDDHRRLLRWAAREAGCAGDASECGGSFWRPVVEDGRVSGFEIHGRSATLCGPLPKAAIGAIREELAVRIATYAANCAAGPRSSQKRSA